MAYAEITFQIVLITIAVYFGRLIFNKIFGMSGPERRELMQKSMDLQKSMNEAMGNQVEIERLQKEAMKLMQQMLKKQLIPMCVSCISFWVLWAILGIIYIEYSVNAGLLPFPMFIFGNGWEGVYILTSFIILGISILTKYIYKKAKGIESTGPGLFDLLSGGASQSAPQKNLSFSTPTSSEREESKKEDTEEDTEEELKPAWKERIKS